MRAKSGATKTINGKNKAIFLATSALAGIALGAGLATAQDYDAKGMPLGSFRLFPTVNVAFAHDDNIYRTDSSTISDSYFLVAPALVLQSDWGRHALNLHVASDTLLYHHRNKEDRTDWNAGADGRIDVRQDVNLTGGGSYNVNHEARTSPDQTFFAAKPTRYVVLHGQAALNFQPSQFGLEIGGSIDNFKYDSTQRIGFIGLLNNSDRDHNEYNGYVKIANEFSPGYAVFLRGNYNDRIFDKSVDRSGDRRDSHGVSVDAGLQMKVTNLIDGSLYVGYIEQIYKSPLPDVTGVDFGGSLDWTPTTQLKINVHALRRLNDTTLSGASASDDRSVGANLTYALRPNINLLGNIDYLDSDFHGNGREDKTLSLGAGAEYMVNRYAKLGGHYFYAQRSSSATGQDYDDNTLLVNLTLQE